MNRSEHLQWAKERAYAEMNRTSSFAGWISFKHDMMKHPELKDHIALELGDLLVASVAVPGLRSGNVDALRVFDLPGPLNIRNFIEGFN